MTRYQINISYSVDNSSPPQGPPASPLYRLNNLLASISTLFTSYSLLPTTSQVYLSSLNSFHQRATYLLGQFNETSPQTEEIERLEKEWWSSEVVAAWYGPRYNLELIKGEKKNRSKKQTTRLDYYQRGSSQVDEGKGLSSQPPSLSINRRRHSSFVGLHDE